MKSLLFILILLPISIVAQEENTIDTWNESYITMDMFSSYYINFSGEYFTPRRRFGYIKSLNDKSKIGLSLGFESKAISLFKTGDKYLLWEIRPEYYRRINSSRNSILYYSVELFYINHKEEFKDQYYVSDQNEKLIFDKADYNRQKFGIIPKLGMFLNLGKRMGFNFYTGIGLKYRINNYSNVVNLQDYQSDLDHSGDYYRKEGNQLGAEFSLGFKVYYRIMK